MFKSLFYSDVALVLCSLVSRYPFVKECVDENDCTQSLSLLPQKNGASRKEPRVIAVNPVLVSDHRDE